MFRRDLSRRWAPRAASARHFGVLIAFRRLETRRTFAAAILGVTVVAIIANLVARAQPGWAVTLGAMAVAAVLFAAITLGVAHLLRPRRVARAAELYRWIGRWSYLRWGRLTGTAVPRSPMAARAWLETHAEIADGLPRVELLVWIGQFDAARRVVAALPRTTPWERFEAALESAFVEFVATGEGDLDPVRSALTVLTDEEARLGGAMLSVEEARQLVGTAAAAASTRSAAGVDWLEPLVRTRDQMGHELDHFLLADLWRWLFRPFVVFGLLSATMAFLVAGALPPR
jgi:hypothetical protein